MLWVLFKRLLFLSVYNYLFVFFIYRLNAALNEDSFMIIILL